MQRKLQYTGKYSSQYLTANKKIRSDLKPLERNWRCKVSPVLDRRAAVTFGPPTGTMEGKLLSLLSNMMNNGTKANSKENQTNQQQNPASRTEKWKSIRKLNCETCLKEKSNAKVKSNQVFEAQPTNRIEYPNNISQHELHMTWSFNVYWKFSLN